MSKRYLHLVDDDLPPPEELEARPPEFSDEELALRYEAEFGVGLRYVAAWNKWFYWSTNRWIEDDELLVYTFARKLCREAAADAARDRATEKYAKAVASNKTVHAVVDLARAAAQIAANVEQWDADPWQLNTPKGVIDLKGDGICQIRPYDYHTKSTAVAPSNDECPRGSPFSIASPPAMSNCKRTCNAWLATASPAQPKSTCCFSFMAPALTAKRFFSTRSLAFSTAMPRPQQSRPSPKRIMSVTRQICHAARRAARQRHRDRARATLDEAKIKALTGGDRIVARFMRQDFFEFGRGSN